MVSSQDGNGGNGGSGGLNGYGPYDARLAQQYGVTYISPDQIYNLHIQATSPKNYMGTGGFLITNEPNLYPNPNILESPLNNNINALIDTYFDPTTNEPTQQMKDMLAFVSQHFYPIDNVHKNKLRDVVYYLMEQIIPGLPTESADYPHFMYSYVEWKPIRWLSNSSL
jgi:hypothetical protein